jgi:hypothetical protein
MPAHAKALIAFFAAAFALAAPATALAHDTYVDRSDGDDAADTNDCSHRATPCASLSRGISQAGTGDTVFVGGDPVAFTGPQDLGDHKSIVHKNFSTTSSVDTSGPTVIDTGGAPNPAITVSSRAGQIKGLTIRSSTLPLEIGAKVDVIHDRFDEPASIDEDVKVDNLALKSRAPTIEHSTFVDPTPLTTEEQRAIDQTSAQAGGVIVSHNRFSDFQLAIDAEGEAITIRNNTIGGTHSGNGFGLGIELNGYDRAVVQHNLLRNPDISTGSVDGVLVSQLASFKGNRISGYQVGVRIADDPERVDLSDDVFMDNAFEAISVGDSAPDPGATDAVLNNETLWDPGASQGEVILIDVGMKMASTIVGPPGIVDFSNSTCAISFSRGPNRHSGGDGCRDFATTKNPRFRGDGYHLKRGSPMIDAGNHHTPKHARDIDGDRRALDGTGDCHGKPRRDIGADEFRC